MLYIGYIIDELFRNHTYKIIVIQWISYQPFEQPAPGWHHRFMQWNEIPRVCVLVCLCVCVRGGGGGCRDSLVKFFHLKNFGEKNNGF